MLEVAHETVAVCTLRGCRCRIQYEWPCKSEGNEAEARKKVNNPSQQCIQSERISTERLKNTQSRNSTDTPVPHEHNTPL